MEPSVGFHSPAIHSTVSLSHNFMPSDYFGMQELNLYACSIGSIKCVYSFYLYLLELLPKVPFNLHCNCYCYKRCHWMTAILNFQPLALSQMNLSLVYSNLNDLLLSLGKVHAKLLFLGKAIKSLNIGLLAQSFNLGTNLVDY